MLNRLVFWGVFFNQNSIYLQVLKIKIENIILFLFFFCFENILSIILFTIIFIISILSLSL